MMLLNGMFCGDNHCFDYTPTDINNINYIKIDNGNYDEVFATNNVKDDYSETSKTWDYDTVFYALFQNNLFAGNVSFTSDTVSAMRLKRRKSSEYTWDVLFEIPIESNEDFNFERFDRFVRGNTGYEYSLVPVINGAEGNLNTSTIETEFEGFYLIEKDLVYRALLNTQLSTDRNHNSTTLSTLGRKFPYHISNGFSNYTSGSLNATFINAGSVTEFDVDSGWKYRDEVDDFLTNGNPKILKNDEGKMWMVAIVDSVSQDYSSYWNMPIHSISWSSIGDPENVDDLFDNNFIDIDSRLI